MDMDILQLPMADMLLSAMDMPLLNTDMDRPLPECPIMDTLLLTHGYASLHEKIKRGAIAQSQLRTAAP